jgi:hypothetical protein
MKTTISIPDSLFIKAEKLAERLGVSRSVLYQRAMRSYIEKYTADEITESLNALYGDPQVESMLDPEIMHFQNMTLAATDW